MAGSAINRTIEQTKAAISMLAPPVSGHRSRLSKTGFLTYDTRASGPKFNRGAGRTTGVFCTLKARSPVCRGPMRSRSPRRCRLTCVPEAFVRGRARNMLAGVDNMPWEDRVGAARALNVAATVLGLGRRSTWASVHVATKTMI